MDFIFLLPISCFFSANAVQPTGAKGDLVEAVRSQEASLIKQFKDESLWTDPKRRPILLKNLKQARHLPSAAYAPLLVKHIALPLTADPQQEPLGLFEDVRPVYAVLKAIGPPAVPHLINRLKQGDFERPANARPESDSSEFKPIPGKAGGPEQSLIISCIIEIYGKGGYGVELTRARITLELQKATGPEQQMLRQALEHRLLKGGK